PSLWRWEQEYGSLLRGAFNDRSLPKSRRELLSFSGGMQNLTDVLARSLPSNNLRLNMPVYSLRPGQNGYQLTLANGDTVQGRQVILAVPAYVAAGLLQAIFPPATQSLTNIPYGRLTVVHTAFDRAAIPHPLDGFGFLVPRKEKMAL